MIPYLNKQDRAQRAELDELFYNAHFLLVPTRSDCFGIVFAEASPSAYRVWRLERVASAERCEMA